MFLPGSFTSAHALDSGVRHALADSLAYIHAAAAKQIGSTDSVVGEVLSELRAHRVRPGVFGRYYDLVLAVQRGNHDEARALFLQIAALAPRRPRWSVLPFTRSALGPDAARFARLTGSGADGPNIDPPRAEQWVRFRQHVSAALDLIEQADAALAAEVRALIVQVIAAVPNARDRGGGFGGVSSFVLWGGIVLNAAAHCTPLDMMEGLVHEAAHQYLFGLSAREPLVSNPVQARYDSPLRRDARPMDGVFHATFVCARLHHAFAQLSRAARSACSADEPAIQQKMSDCRKRFADGLHTVQRFGELTPTGKNVLEAASDYMRRAA